MARPLHTVEKYIEGHRETVQNDKFQHTEVGEVPSSSHWGTWTTTTITRGIFQVPLLRQSFLCIQTVTLIFSSNRVTWIESIVIKRLNCINSMPIISTTLINTFNFLQQKCISRINRKAIFHKFTRIIWFNLKFRNSVELNNLLPNVNHSSNVIQNSAWKRHYDSVASNTYIF